MVYTCRLETPAQPVIRKPVITADILDSGDSNDVGKSLYIFFVAIIIEEPIGLGVKN